MTAILRLLPVIASRKRLFVETVLLSAACQLTVVALGVVTSWTVGRVAAGIPVPLGAAMAVAAGLAVVAALATWRESWVSHDLAYRLLATLRSRVFDAPRVALPSRRRPRRTGDLATALVADIETLEWLYAHTVAQSLSAFLVLAAAAVVSLAVNPLLLAVWVPLLVVGVMVPLLTARRAKADGSRLSAGATRLRSELLDTVRGLRDLTGAGALDTQFARLTAETRDIAKVQVREASRLGMERAIADAALAFAAVGSIAVAVVSSRGIAPGLLPLAFTVAVAGLSPAAQIADLLRGLGVLRAATERIVGVLDEPPAVVSGAGTRSSDGASKEGSSADVRHGAASGHAHRRATRAHNPSEPGLVFDSVSFSYTGDSPVLHHFSMHVEPGEIVALVGATGAGKTTAARLALRMWDPDAGAVRVGGVDLRNLTDSELRALISTVPQSSPLLKGTIGTNIVLGNPSATHTDIEQAAHLAGIFAPEAGLPRGLETPVSEHGAGLSGGQRARVAMARALLMNPRVLVLDEPTASLDPEADAALMELLRTNRDRAVLLIAHRPTTIAAADRRVRMVAQTPNAR